MCGTRGVCDRNARGEAGALAEGAQASAKTLFSPVEVIAAGEVQPQAVGRRRGRNGRPAPNGKQRQAVEQDRVRLWLGGPEVEIGHQSAGMGGGHSDMDAERGRRSACSHDFLTPPDLADKRQRSMSGCGPCHDHGRSGDRLALVRMARGFRSPPEFAHGRLRMRRKRGDLPGNLDLGRRLRSRPARPRPPSATPGDRAFTRIVVDRELER